MSSKVLIQVEGMDCANCAQSITRVLEKAGLDQVNVNFATGEVVFEKKQEEELETAISGIRKLGYKVVGNKSTAVGTHEHLHHQSDDSISNSLSLKTKFRIALLFSLPLLAHMFLTGTFISNPIFQLIVCLPVMWIGVNHFGKSAWHSLRAGVPNMDVLIIIGSSAAFIYSVAGTYLYFGTEHVHHYLFYETAAAIITLVLLGNLIEQKSVRQTTSALQELMKLQPSTGKRIILKNGIEEIETVEIDRIRKEDRLLVNTGDKIPVDGRLEEGSGSVNESIITGESMPVLKTKGMELNGGTIVESGSFRMIVEKIGDETTLAKIIELVKNAQNSKPPLQRLGDRISAIFVPVVVVISVVTFITAYFIFHVSIQQSLMNSIAVLVISCPCAMGLATPTAVMVGLGRAATNGILIKGGDTLERFSSLRTIVFDKTGTLTTGKFKIRSIDPMKEDLNFIKSLLFALERHSSHPIARSIITELKEHESSANRFSWSKIDEDRGIGINATDAEGNLYSAGSFQMVKHNYADLSHSIYILKNNILIATVDLEDEVKPGTHETIARLKAAGMRVIMVSGDRAVVCEQVAEKAGITEIYSEQKPKQKLELIERFSKESTTAMVGDGINDAPALARASIGISMSNATHTAIESSQVILVNHSDLSILIKALNIGKKTYKTIRQNLFWAFFYNAVAIPFAAVGFLSPIIGAFSMAFSDVIVIGNSLLLKIRKID